MAIQPPRETLFEVYGVKQALWLLLGDGLDETGKEMWLEMRLEQGMDAPAIFDEALSLIEGQIAT